MIEQLARRAAQRPERGAPSAERLMVEPFLHFGPDRIYNTLTDRFLDRGQPGFSELHALHAGSIAPGALDADLRNDLFDGAWLIEAVPPVRLAARFRLKYASLEASTVCNQACYFCPVSVARRDDHLMSMEFYQQVVAQLAAHRDTLEGVSMIQYNEPTADKRFVDQVRMLKSHGLPPAVFSNATGLTPGRVDAILEMGGLQYLSINLSTLDRERYLHDRGGDHLPLVLRNLDYIRDEPLAASMDIAVLGTGDDAHRRDFEQIRERFRDSRFNVLFYQVMNRAGAAPIGLHVEHLGKRLCGCEQTGSRPVQWVHVNPMGQCVLCCQDYHNQYVIGDLHQETLDAILAGPRMSLYRRWAYGMEEAPADFICRHCVYALTADG